MLLWGNDHLPRHDRANGLIRLDLVASQSLQGKPCGGGREPDRQMGVFRDVFGNSLGDPGVLLYPGVFQHRKYHPQHPVRDHQLHRRVSDLPPESLLCSGLCRQRCGADRSVDPGRKGGYQLFVRYHLLYHVSGQ